MAKDKNKFTQGRISSLRSNKSVLSRTVQSKRAADKAKPARKAVKRKLGSGPCPNVQIRDLDDTFSDLEEQEFEDLQSKKVVEEEDIRIEIDVNADNDVEEEHMGMENDVGANKDVGIEEMQAEDDGNADHVVEPTKKRKNVVRGKTTMKGLGIEYNDKKVVAFNSKDQPIGDHSVKLSSVLGVLVRRNISLTHRDWRKVPVNSKDNIWRVVKQRFIIDDYYKDYYVGKMGSLLKEARSRTAGLVLGAFLLDEEKREERLAVIKPQNMTTREWEEFVKYVCSAEFKVKRLQMQIIRQKSTTPHTISRQGYARLEEKMQQELNTKDEIPRVELWKAGHKQKQGKQPNIATQEALDKVNRYQEEHGTDCGSSLKDDILSKALGEDRPGRVKGLGYGVTRTKMTIQSQYIKTIKSLVDEVQFLGNKVVTLEERIPRTVLDDGSSLHKVGESSSSQRIGTPNSGAASNYNLVGHRDISPTSGGPSGSSPSSRPTGVQVPKKNQACKLLSWYNEGEVVADGRIHETDPKKKIHGMPIGFGVYSVWVDHSLVDGAHLYRPTSDLRCVLNATGTTVAWPKDYISFEQA